MMRLSQASSYFDRTEVLEPDTGEVLFLGQVDPYDDSKRDAGAAYRRVLSVAAGTAVPAARAVRVHGQVWTLGATERDGLEEVHREKYVLQPAQRWGVSRLDAYLSGATNLQLWGGVEWAKDLKESEASSKVASQFSGLFAQGADVRVNDVIHGPEAYLVRAVRVMPSGFLALMLARLDYSVEACTVTERIYNPVTGGYTSPNAQAVQSLRVRWQDMFVYSTQAAARHKPGDDVLVVPADTVVSTASQVLAQDPLAGFWNDGSVWDDSTFWSDGAAWAVLAVETLGAVKALHLRAA